jgi:rhodanese-related sulfurtransferase
MSAKKYLKDQVPTVQIQDPSDIIGFELIDVRRSDEYTGELGHIEKAKLFTLGPDLEKFLITADKNSPILFICRSGARSAGATMRAMELGFKEVYNMEGGMIYWNELKFPVQR